MSKRANVADGRSAPNRRRADVEKEGGEHQSPMIAVRWTEAERALLKRAAALQGVPLAHVIRVPAIASARRVVGETGEAQAIEPVSDVPLITSATPLLERLRPSNEGNNGA